MAAVAASAAAAAATTTTSSTSSSSSSSISTITFNAFTPKAHQLAQQRGQLEDFICLQNNVAMLSEPVHGLLNAIYEFVHKMQSTLIHSIMNDKEQLSVDERKETLSFISRFFS